MSGITAQITSAALSALVVSLAGVAVLTGHATFDQFIAVASPFAGGTALLHIAKAPSS